MAGDSKRETRGADEIEKEMTEAANRGDREEFQKALNNWRECFH